LGRGRGLRLAADWLGKLLVVLLPRREGDRGRQQAGRSASVFASTSTHSGYAHILGGGGPNATACWKTKRNGQARAAAAAVATPPSPPPSSLLTTTTASTD
ncbi:unnamed protein product, partial [Scytosiphon promiscuus]